MQLQWSLSKSHPDEYQSPDEMSDEVSWYCANVPGTVAESLNSQNSDNTNSFDDLDDYDWWYKAKLPTFTDEHSRLRFSGLTPCCEVWLDNNKVLTADNMFRSFETDITRSHSDIFLVFRSINKKSQAIKKRARWKTKLVKHQKLNHFRTSLLGRIPGWTPAIPPIGPWKEIELLTDKNPLSVSKNSYLNNDEGIVDIAVTFQDSVDIKKIEFNLEDCKSQQLDLTILDGVKKFSGKLIIKNPKLWSPHTHGFPNLYSNKLIIHTDNNISERSLSPLGFKKVELVDPNHHFQIKINDSDIFLRGACWTVNDVEKITGDEASLTQKLKLFQKAGGNLIRVVGTMTYESDKFYELCDQFGILVWQDFMFANMDYPFDNENFHANVIYEIKEQTNRIAQHPSIGIFCGNSEIQQQVTMLGFEKQYLESNFFDKECRDIVQELKSAIPYVPSSPCGSDLPFRTNEGLSHYFGIGAYLRPLSEIRLHDVKFTSECLGFANIPSIETRKSMFEGGVPNCHEPIWKSNTPRDTGAGWDFEDVRDHYLRELYDVDPTELRSTEPDMYFSYSELTTAHVMSHAFAEWRSNFSNCNGAIVWFYNDFTEGAGWGIIDSNSIPKSSYFALKRNWQPIHLAITNESVNGLVIHVVNESNLSMPAQIIIQTNNIIGSKITSISKEIQLDASCSLDLNIESLMGSFMDINYQYRFGSQNINSVSAKLLVNGKAIADTSYIVKLSKISKVQSSELKASFIIDGDITKLSLTAHTHFHGIHIQMRDFDLSDNYFDLFDGDEKIITLEKKSDSSKLKCNITAANMIGSLRLAN